MIEKILMELCEIKQLLCLGKEVLSVKEFCLYADLSEDYVRKLQRENKLPFTRPFGKKLYIAKQDAIKVLLQNPILTNDAVNEEVNNYLLTSKSAA